MFALFDGDNAVAGRHAGEQVVGEGGDETFHVTTVVGLGNSKTGGGEHGSKIVVVLTEGERHLILLRTLIGDHTTRNRHAVHHAMQQRCVWFERDGAAEPRRAFSEETANRSGGTRL